MVDCDLVVEELLRLDIATGMPAPQRAITPWWHSNPPVAKKQETASLRRKCLQLVGGMIKLGACVPARHPWRRTKKERRGLADAHPGANAGPNTRCAGKGHECP
jgi:hypothetical protein